MEPGHSSGEIEVSPAGSKPSLASTAHRIDEAYGLKSDLIDEVPARVILSNSQPKMIENAGNHGVYAERPSRGLEASAEGVSQREAGSLELVLSGLSADDVLGDEFTELRVQVNGCLKEGLFLGFPSVHQKDSSSSKKDNE